MNRYVKFLTLMVSFATGILIIFILKSLSSIFIPLFLSLVFAFILNPVVEWLVKKRVPRIVAIFVAIFILLAVVTVFISISSASIFTFAHELPKYQEKFYKMFIDTFKNIDDLRLMVADRFNIQVAEFNFSTLMKNLDWGTFGTSVAKSLYGFSMTFFKYIIFIVIFMLFIFSEFTSLNCKVKSAFPTKGDGIADVIYDIKSQVVKYMSLKFIFSFITGVVVYLFLFLLGMDFPVIWGILAFIFNFLPTIGSIFITFMVGFFALAQFYPSWGSVFLAFFLVGATEFLIGNIIEPKFQGSKFNLSPLVVLVSLLIWNWIWGPIGMFLSVPIIMFIKIVFNSIPTLKPIAILIGGGTNADTEKRGSLKILKDKILKLIKKGRKE